MAQAIGGVAFVKINGSQFLLRGNLKINPLNLESEIVVGQDTVHGYTQKPVAPSIEMDVSDIGGLALADLQNITGGATITADLKNGKSYILIDSVFVGPADLNTAEGMVTLKFSGAVLRELTA